MYTRGGGRESRWYTREGERRSRRRTHGEGVESVHTGLWWEGEYSVYARGGEAE